MNRNFLNGFGFENFKCFQDEAKISSKPITINIGPNNSGKSSVFKLINLIQSSITIQGKKEIRKYPEIIDTLDSSQIKNFGFSNDFLFDSSKSLVISIPIYPFKDNYLLLNKNIKAKLHFSFNPSETKLHNENSFSIDGIPNLGVLYKYDVYLDNEILFSIKKIPSINSVDEHLNKNGIGKFELYKSILFSNISDFNALDYSTEFSALHFSDLFEIKSHLSKEFLLLNNNVKKIILEILGLTENSIRQFCYELKNVQFIHLNRREFGRYFNINNSVIFFDFYKHFFSRNNYTVPNLYENLNKVLHLFEMPANIKIIPYKNLGFQIYFIDQNSKIRNISDFGSGINQILPLILTSIIKLTSSLIYDPNNLEHDQKFEYIPHTILVEEPESNFHPNYQSKLADMFMILYKEFNLNFIIETHSEYMLRKFQYLVANGELPMNDIVINYFWIDKGIHRCKQIEFNSDGSFTAPFEDGFYNESYILKHDLPISQN